MKNCDKIVFQSVEFTYITSAKQFPLEQLKRGMSNFPFILSPESITNFPQRY